MHKPKYPQLRQHQQLIGQTGFLNPPIENDRTLLLSQGQPFWKGVCELNKGGNRSSRLVVRVYLSGAQILIAQLLPAEYLNACRIYDLSLRFFWKYRLRGELKNDHFNFSLDQANYDLEHEPVHADLLAGLEAGLIAAGALPNAEQLAKLTAEAAAPKVETSLRKKVDTFPAMLGGLVEEMRQSFLFLRGEHLGHTQKLQSVLDTLDADGKSLHTYLESRAVQLDTRLANLELRTGKLESLERALGQLVIILRHMQNKNQKQDV